MDKAFYDVVNVRLFFLAFVVLMLGSIEAGFRLGERTRSKFDAKTGLDVSMIAAAILGILGLLLGFTLSMAVSRFETRRQLVLEEANAIGTAYLRTKLLPAPDSVEIANLLSEYVDARLQYAASGRDFEQTLVAREKAVRLQNNFWERASAYARRNPNPVIAGLLLQSLNQAIDLELARWTALHNHVPESVIYMIAVVALLAASVIGYSFGINGQRQLFSSFALTLAVTLVLTVIVDIDSPRAGLIRVSQRPMIELQRQLSTRNH